MKIENNAVVRFHYSVAEVGQPEAENSRIGEPLMVLIGHHNIIPGIENALIGREAGERFEITVAPEQGYGPRHAGLTQRLSKKLFAKSATLKPGETVMLKSDKGPRIVTVQKVGMTVVDVDLNHPMAGKNLHFDIEIVEVREGTAEEIAHRHAHGTGGVAH